MSKVRCPKCDAYDTYNIKTRYAQVGVFLYFLFGLWFWTGTIVGHVFEYILAGACFLAATGFILRSLQLDTVYYCKHCEKRFYPNNVKPSLFDRFH